MSRRRDELLRRIPVTRLFVLVVAIGVLPYVAMMLRPSTSSLAPDSWSYYDLALTVFGDFYRPVVTRAFHERHGYSRSFPPLWPVLIAIAEFALRMGPATGVVLAPAFALLTLIPLTAIARSCIPRRTLASFAAGVMWFALLWFPAYWQEAYFGGSIPLTVLLLAGAAACLVRDDVERRVVVAASAGLLLGLACLTRFDALGFSALVIAWSLVSGMRPAAKIAMIAAFGVAISPWVLYSSTHYATLWASDNTAVMVSAAPHRVNDYEFGSDTIATAPARWLLRVTGNSVKLLLTVVQAIGVHPLLPMLVAAAAVALLTSRGRRQSSVESPLVRLMVVTGAAFGGFAPQVLTGYFDLRYYSFFCLLATSCAVCVVLTRAQAIRIVVTLGVLVLLVVSPLRVIEWLRQQSRGDQSIRLRAELRDELLAHYRSATLLADDLCFETGVVTRIPTVCLPNDWERLSRERKREFIKSLGITHALEHGPHAGELRVERVHEESAVRTH